MTPHLLYTLGLEEQLMFPEIEYVKWGIFVRHPARFILVGSGRSFLLAWHALYLPYSTSPTELALSFTCQQPLLLRK